jgi:general stress protein YciG
MKTQTAMLEGMATKKDFNQTAFSIVQQATGETVPEPIDEKKKAAQESGRRGGLIGGAVRASKLTPEKRLEIGKKAAKARWSKA